MSLLPIIRQEIKSVARIFALDEPHAFPVWFAKVVIDLDDDDAFEALALEGPNEKGIDVFWVDQQNKKVFIAQCKYSAKGNHRPKLKDLDNFLACTDWLASPEDLRREGRPELASAAKEFNDAVNQDYLIRLWYVYCGPKDTNIEKRIRLYNANPDNEQRNRSAIHCDLALIQSIYEEWRGEGRRIHSAKLRVASQAFEVEGSFGKGLVVSIPASELVRLYEEFGDQLFARNVRGWLGARKGSVNASIIATLENDNERGNFWAYNNGITLVCDGYKHDPDTATFVLEKFSIVNGCQTTVALAKSAIPHDQSQVLVLARIICPPETIIDSVIRFTNSQNLIRRWDLASQDPIQRRLKREFEDLANPVYYAIRRGEWAALTAADKVKFKPAIGPARIVRHDLLAQYLAVFRGMAVVAYKNKAFLFDRYYDQTFSADVRVEEVLFIWRAGEIVQAQVREEIRAESDKVQRGDKGREKYVFMLKRGGRFYVLAVLGVVARLRNGTDYLRSITEERTTSNAAKERIEKYAKVSVQWYKQAVDDLRAISSADLSVLVREADFFDRVAERITNQYEAMKVNEDWLSGALPRLF